MATLEAVIGELQRSERTMAIQQNAMDNVGVNPDDYAKRRSVAKAFGVPTPETQDTWEGLQLRKVAMDARRYADVPVLNEMLANRETAKLIANSPVDWDLLSTTSKFAQAYKMGRLQSNLNDALKRLELNASQRAAGLSTDSTKYAPEQVAEIQRQMGMLSVNPTLQAIQDSESVWDMLKLTAANPVNTMALPTITSLSTSPAGTLGTAVAGALTGMAGAAVVQGLSSFEAEYGATFADQLTAHGVDLTNPDSVRQAMNNPELMKECSELAKSRATAVASMDALSLGVAKYSIRPFTYLNGLAATKGKLGQGAAMLVGEKAVGSGLSKAEDVVTQLAVQGALGGAGEALGNVVIGKDVSIGDVYLEAVNGLATAPLDLVSARYEYTHRVDENRRVQETVTRGAVVKGILNAGAQMPLKDRAPDVAVKAVQDIAVEAGIPTVTINVNDLNDVVTEAATESTTKANTESAPSVLPLWSRAPVDSAATETARPVLSPWLQRAIDRLSNSGGDIQIPVGEVYRISLQSPELANRILQGSRFTKDGVSLALAQAYDFDGQMKRSAERLIEETKRNFEEKKARAAEAEKAFAPAKDELKKTGLTEEQVNDSVSVYQAMAQSTAEMLDMPVGEFVDKFGLRVVAGDSADAMVSAESAARPSRTAPSRERPKREPLDPMSARATWIEEAKGYRENLKKKEAQLREKEAELKEAKDAIEAGKTENERLLALRTQPLGADDQRVKDEYTKTLNSRTAEREELEKDIKRREGELEKLKKSAEITKRALEKATTNGANQETIGKRRRDVTGVDNKVAEHNTAIRAAKKRLKKIDADIKRYKKLLERDPQAKNRKVLEDARVGVFANMAEYNERIPYLEGEVERLRKEVQEAREPLDEVLTKLRLQSAAAEARDNKVARLQVDIDTYKAIIDSAKKRIKWIRERIEDRLHAIEASREHIEGAPSGAKRAKAESERIKSQLAEIERKRENNLEQIRALEKELKDLEASFKGDEERRKYLADRVHRRPKGKARDRIQKTLDDFERDVKARQYRYGIIPSLLDIKRAKAEEYVRKTNRNIRRANENLSKNEQFLEGLQRRTTEREYAKLFDEIEVRQLTMESYQLESDIVDSEEAIAQLDIRKQWVNTEYAERETLLYQEAMLPDEEREAIPAISVEERARRAAQWRDTSVEERAAALDRQRARRIQALGAYDSTQQIVYLFTNTQVNASTFVHETAHHFLNVMTRTALPLIEQALEGVRPLKQGEEKLVNLIGGFFKWGGLWDPKSGLLGLRDVLADWTSRDVDGQRAMQEQFARGMEAYLASGSAPTSGMQMMFDRFAQWLKEIYVDIRRITGMKPLSPEVAALYDQLFTSERAVQEARMRYSEVQASANTSLYDDLIKSGMTEDEFKQFVDLREEARMSAEATISAQMSKGLKVGKAAAEGKIRGYTRDYKAFRQQAQVQVEADKGVSTLNSYRRPRTVEVLNRNGNPKKVKVFTKIRLDSVPEGFRDQLVAIGVAADLGEKNTEYHTLGEEALAHGALSTDDYVSTLLTAASVDQEGLIEQIAQDKFREKYDVTYTEKNLELLADRALSNKARFKVLATEVAALKKTTGNAAALSAATRAWAKNKVADMRHSGFDPIKGRYHLNGSPEGFRSTAKYLANQALNWFSKGDISKAGDAKDGQLKQEMLAVALEESRETARKFNRKLATTLRSKTIDGSYKEQIRAIAHHLGKETGLPEGAPNIVVFMEDNVALQSIWSTLSDRVREILSSESESEVLNWRLLRNGDIEGVYKLVLSLAAQGAVEGKSAVLERKVEAEMLLAEADTSIADAAKNMGREPKVAGATETRYWKKAMAGAKNFFFAHLPAVAAMQILDGNQQGKLTQSLVWSADDCGNRQVDMEKHYGAELATILGEVATSKFNTDFRDVLGVGRLNLHNLFSVVLNMGNEGNSKRLAEGNGIDFEAQMRCAEQLTAAQLEAVNKVWALFEDLRKKAAVVYRNLTGTEPNWIEPVPFTVHSADGVDVQMTGGYVPIKYDPAASKQKLGTNFTDNESLEEAAKTNNTSVTTARTYTKDRANAAPAGAVLRLDTQCIYDGFNEVIRDICWREWISNTQRVFDGFSMEYVDTDGKKKTRKIEGLLDKVNRYYGNEMVQVFREWVKNIATGGRQFNQGAADSAMAVLRSGVSLAGLGFNFTTALIQVTGLITAAPVVGARYMLAGIGDILSNPTDTWKSAARMSSLMRNRAITRTREIADARNIAERGRSYYKIKETTYNVAYGAMMAVQGVVDHVVFSAALRKAYDMGLVGDEAVHYADRVVIDTQGSGLVKDSSAMENGTALQRVFMVFYSFMGRALGLNAMAMMGEKDRIKAWTQILTVCMITPLIESVLRSALQPGGDDGDQWDSMDDMEKLEYGLRYVTGTTGSFVLGQFMLGREFSSMWENFFKGDPVFTWRGPSGLRAIGDVGQFLSQAQQSEWDAALTMSIINVMGDFGLPGAAQLNRTIAGWDALDKGTTDNWWSLVFGYKK